MIGVFSFLAGFWTFLSERVRINNISDRFMNGIIDSDKCDRGFKSRKKYSWFSNLLFYNEFRMADGKSGAWVKEREDSLSENL